MKKIMLVFGTRPEAIKMAPIIHALNEENSRCKPVICVTAQHRQMLDQVLKIFDIRPDYDLDIMQQGQDLFDITIDALRGLKGVLQKERPDVVLVQGDTTTALVAGLASYYLKISIGHVEAGLRTHNKYSPFPEEKNRHLLSTLADYHFAPTEWSQSNLHREGIHPDQTWVTGNTVIDALLMIAHRQEDRSVHSTLKHYFADTWQLPLEENGSRLLLVTGHRRENFGAGFQNICRALKSIAESRPDVTIVYPVHLNPNVQAPVRTILEGQGNIRLIEPLDYEPFVFLMKHAYLILTDSGGIQEEAPSLGKPVLVMRDTTERPEGIKAGTVKLVGTDQDAIIDNTLLLLDDRHVYESMARSANPYGNGLASKRIVDILLRS